MHVEERTLDVNKKGGRAGQIKPVILRRGEANQTQIKVNLTSDGAPYSTGNLTAKFCAFLPSKKYVKDSSHTTKDANSITYTVQSDITSAAGDIRICYVELTSADNYITSDTLPIIVLDNVEMTDEEAKYYKSTIDEMLEQLEDCITQADTARDNANSAADAANKAESETKTAEAERVKAEQARVDAEKARETAEQKRDSAESERIAAEAKRVQAELERVTAEAQRAAAELARVQAESERVTAQAKNNADQAANNLAAAQAAPHVCVAGEYNTSTLKPTLEATQEGRIYLVPSGGSGDDKYIEWMWLNGEWEQIGTSSGGNIAYITTDQIDQVIADDSPSGDTLLNLTGLSYVWAKIKAWATGLFRSKNDLIGTNDIAGSAITQAKIGTGAVGSNQLASSAVTNVKLGPNAVTTDKIQDGTILLADMSQDFQQSFSDYGSRIEGLEEAWDSATQWKLHNLGSAATLYENGIIGVIDFFTGASFSADSVNFQSTGWPAIPEGLRPVRDVYATCSVRSTAGVYSHALFYISSANGNTLVLSPVATNMAHIHVTYAINNS